MEQILNTDQELEQSILGSLILRNELFFSVDLAEEDFAFELHRKIFNHLAKSLKGDLPANQSSLKDFFVSLGEGEYLKQLLSAADHLEFKTNVQILQELARKRKLKEISLEMSEMSLDGSKNSQEIKDVVSELLEEVQFGNVKKTRQLYDIAKEAFSRKDFSFIKTGLKSLDEVLTGLSEGEFVVLAGRPSMGKSALALNIALNVAKAEPVIFFSLEMSDEQISKRAMARIASLHLTKLKYNNLESQHEVEAFQAGMQKMEKLKLEIRDEAGITLNKIRHEVKKFRKKGGRFVVIDYIQLIKHSNKHGNVERVTEITNELKRIALEFKVVILGLSQLSRAVEQREDKRPQLSDLRDSGSIEQDADIVIFAFRPEYYVEKEKPFDGNGLEKWQEAMDGVKGLAFAIVAKMRDGACGEARLKFEGEFGRFTELNNF